MVIFHSYVAVYQRVMPTSQNPLEIPRQNSSPGGSNPATAGSIAGAATGSGSAATAASGSGAGRRSVVPTAPKGSGSEVGSLVQLTR